MKKYVWSKVIVEGGQRFLGKLSSPPDNTGALQNEMLRSSEGLHPIPHYYADSAVVAYRLPVTDVSLSSFHPTMSSSGGNPDYAMLIDGDLAKITSIAIPSQGEDAWIQYAFPHAVTIRAVSIVTQDPSRTISMIYGIAAPQKALNPVGSAPTGYQIAELVLHPGARVNHFEEKEAFVPTVDLYQFPTSVFGPDSVVRE